MCLSGTGVVTPVVDDCITVVEVGNADSTIPVVILTLLGIVVLDNKDCEELSIVDVIAVLLGGKEDMVAGSDTALTLGDVIVTVPFTRDDTFISLLVSGINDVTLSLTVGIGKVMTACVTVSFVDVIVTFDEVTAKSGTLILKVEANLPVVTLVVEGGVSLAIVVGLEVVGTGSVGLLDTLVVLCTDSVGRVATLLVLSIVVCLAVGVVGGRVGVVNLSGVTESCWKAREEAE